MNYIENIYVCIAAPVLIAVLCLHGKNRRQLLFFTAGMTACLLSSYISTFLAAVYGADIRAASMEIAPLVEEIMKLLPVLFYLLVFEPDRQQGSGSMLMTAVGFATFENICYLTVNSADRFSHLLIRGFGTGAMHVICGALTAIGLLYLWDRLWLRVAGTIGLLAAAITYHGIYNILVSQPGAASQIGFLIPIMSTAAYLVLRRYYPHIFAGST